jgi:hypothetical protein
MCACVHASLALFMCCICTTTQVMMRVWDVANKEMKVHVEVTSVKCRLSFQDAMLTAHDLYLRHVRPCVCVRVFFHVLLNCASRCVCIPFSLCVVFRLPTSASSSLGSRSRTRGILSTCASGASLTRQKKTCRRCAWVYMCMCMCMCMYV